MSSETGPASIPQQPAPGRWPSGLRWLAGVVVTLGLLLTLTLGAVWVWTGQDGSLARALDWAARYSRGEGPGVASPGTPAAWGRLDASGVQGSIRGGGQVGRLQWQQDGLTVELLGMAIEPGNGFWMRLLTGQGVHLERLSVARLRVDDRRPPPADPAPLQPLTTLELPMPVSVSVALDDIELSGALQARLGPLKARYAYGPAADHGRLGPHDLAGVQDVHTLRVETLQIAGGRYRVQAAMGAQAPMPLRLDSQAEVDTAVPGGESLALRGKAQLGGTLSGPEAALDLSAHLQPAQERPASPTLAAKARIKPWARQPLDEADVRLHRLDLASLWPGAPTTALGGTLAARPEGDAWRVQADLQNLAAGPADRQRVPVDQLQAAARWQEQRWTLERLDTRLGSGRLQASGEWAPAAAGGAQPPVWNGEARITGINPAQLWSALAPAALDGRAQARTGSGSGIDWQLAVQPSGRQPARSTADTLRLRQVQARGRWTPAAGTDAAGTLELAELQLDALDAQLRGQGRYVHPGGRAEARLTLALPGTRLQGDVDMAAAAGDGDVRLDLTDAAATLAWARRLRELPVVGAAVAQALPDMQAGGSGRLQLRWQGGLGALGWPGAAGATRAEVPTLDLGLSLDRLQIGLPAVEGGPATRFDLAGTELTLRGPADRLDVGLRAQAAQTAPAPRSLRVDLQGRVESRGRPLLRSGLVELDRAVLDLSDRSREGQVLGGVLQTLQPLRLRWQTEGPVRIDADAARWRLQPRLPGAPAGTASPVDIGWDTLAWNAGALQTRGQLSGLPLAWVDLISVVDGARNGPLARAGLGGDLVFDGRWDIDLPADATRTPTVDVLLARRSGDLLVQTDGAFDEANTAVQRLPAGIRQAELRLTGQGRDLQARLRWQAERLGEASADLSTRLAPPDSEHGAWHWPASAPLQGRLQASLPQAGLWSALAPPGWRVRGTLAAQATVAGTRGDPRIEGSLQADQVAVRSLVDGIAFVNGQLRATLAGDRIAIDRFRIEGRGGAERGGVLEATGRAEFPLTTVDGQSRRVPALRLEAQARALRVSSRPDRRLTLSGDVQAALNGPDLQLRGSLRTDSALIILPDELAPSLSSDVVVRGTERAIEPAAGQRVRPDVQIDLDLGRDFTVRGQGLDTRLEGNLTLRSTPALPAPRLLGEVRTVSGSYRSYGQQLSIETGVLRFNGPFDNPTLDITAVRPNTAQRVGVIITGSASAPRVRLFSEPDLPDSEKLAWLVLGRPASGAGAEAAVLQQAAAALIAGGGDRRGGLAQAFGLDEISVGSSGLNPDGTPATAVTLGKRLTQDLYLSYERSVAGAVGTMSIFYDVSRRFTVRARAGEENALDLIFTLQFD